MLRIIAGEFRSRRLATPADDRSTRPYTSMARESVFNVLRAWFDGACVLDLFAGVGTMGLEAVSRGAKRVVMVERDRTVYELLERNATDLACLDRVALVRADALAESTLVRAASAAGAPFDVVFVDPPYALMEDDSGRTRVRAQVQRLGALMARESFLVLRSPIDPQRFDARIEGFIGPEPHVFGHDMWVLLYQPQRDGNAGTAPERAQ